tara:strand:- start:13555 stop:13731 length:177 start_codon:yes stop_codon:yes gene_type:complete
MKCVICKEKIETDLNGWKGGHNAEPVAKGRCCEECNYSIVLHERIKLMFNRQLNGTKS